ncbi:MAG TPA: bifunctional DNA primase/polymerase [Micromonosporaceae bacterium]|nr:bifunctional DNA primase/polymerase [Micromonosporaceae bacterium]
MPYPARPLPTDRHLRAALDYADAGLSVFLLGRSKRPVANCRLCPKHPPAHDPETCECLTCHGFYAATTDPDRVRAMFEAVPDGLLAIRTGAVSDRLVLDIDPRNGGRVDLELMVPTATVATGGGGWHLHYRHPGIAVPAKLPGHPGVDIKTDGGYTVAPPSIHPATKQPYRWVGNRPVVEMPPPLIRACLTALERPAPSQREPAITHGARGISSPTALLAAHLDAVRRAPEGNRRTTLYGAARGVARMVAAGAITADDARAELAVVGREAEQTDRDIRAAINGGFRAEGVTV